MKTDWNLIRKMINTAVDACEQIEAIGYSEEDREATVNVQGHDVSVFEFLISAWTLPENLRYQIVRERYAKGNDLPYVPEAARIITSMAHACAELIYAGDSSPAHADIEKMLRWYDTIAVPGIKRAIADNRQHGGSRS